MSKWSLSKLKEEHLIGKQLLSLGFSWKFDLGEFSTLILLRVRLCPYVPLWLSLSLFYCYRHYPLSFTVIMTVFPNRSLVYRIRSLAIHQVVRRWMCASLYIPFFSWLTLYIYTRGIYSRALPPLRHTTSLITASLHPYTWHFLLLHEQIHLRWDTR